MVSAVVLLKTHRGLINEVATQLAELDGISEVFSVGGRYDLVAILRVSEPLRLAFVDALHDRALQTLRRAAQDPSYAETLAADLLALDVPEVG